METKTKALAEFWNGSAQEWEDCLVVGDVQHLEKNTDVALTVVFRDSEIVDVHPGSVRGTCRAVEVTPELMQRVAERASQLAVDTEYLKRRLSGDYAIAEQERKDAIQERRMG